MAASDAARAMAIRAHLNSGQVIPAHPLALTAQRTLDERRQRALTRYYVDAGAGGIAVGVHTTQFAIRDARHGLYRPVMELAAETARTQAKSDQPFVLVAGAVGDTKQAVAEAELAASLGYDLVLLSLAALPDASDAVLIEHCRAVAEVLPLFGFYLQPAVGGRVLSYAFWRELAELDRLWAIKIAPFNRYRTLDVVRAISDARRDDVALYTGNDDSILVDLLTPFPGREAASPPRRIVGGLLGQYAVWTHAAVRQLERVRAVRDSVLSEPGSPSGIRSNESAGTSIHAAWLTEAAALTDANAAVFDAAHDFAGCIPGIHEVLRRQGLLAGTWCLDPNEQLSDGQSAEIDRVCRRYPFLTDDAFVAERLDRWLA